MGFLEIYFNNFEQVRKGIGLGLTREELDKVKDNLIERDTTVGDYIRIRLRIGEIVWQDDRLVLAHPRQRLGTSR